jgi:hypothetical protein
MEAITITTKDGQVVPAFRFNGRVYRKHDGGRYYTTGRRKLHRDVWEYFNGPIPQGYQIHHKDFDTDNNSVDNLVCVSIKEHHKIHKEHDQENGTAERRRQHFNDIRPLASEWHRSEEGREWHSQHARKQERKDIKKVCVVCGKEYTTKNPSSKYCSNRCNAKSRRQSGIDNETRICAVCGQPFETNKYGKQQYCSVSCGSKHRRSLSKKGKGV